MDCSAADKITRFDTDGYTTDYACEIKFGDGTNDTFFPDEWMDPKDQRKVDYFILYGVAAAEQAFKILVGCLQLIMEKTEQV